MIVEKTKVEWVSDRVFLLKDRNDFPIIMAQPAGVNGADLLPLSLMGCSAWAIMGIVQKQRQQLTGLSVSAESERESEPPWRFRKIRLRYRFTGHNLDARRIQHAVDLSEAKYCSIYATLREAVKLVSECEIIEE